MKFIKNELEVKKTGDQSYEVYLITVVKGRLFTNYKRTERELITKFDASTPFDAFTAIRTAMIAYITHKRWSLRDRCFYYIDPDNFRKYVVWS